MTEQQKRIQYAVHVELDALKQTLVADAVAFVQITVYKREEDASVGMHVTVSAKTELDWPMKHENELANRLSLTLIAWLREHGLTYRTNATPDPSEN